MRTDQTIKNRYVVTAGVSNYDAEFPIYAETDVAVWLSHDGGVTETCLTLGTDYSVSIAQDFSYGTVTLKPAAGAVEGDVLALVSNLPYTQELDLSNVSTIDTEAAEIQLDRDCQQRQQLAYDLERVYKLPFTSEMTGEEYMEAVQEQIATAVETAQGAASDVATLDANAVKLTGNQTINGTKTFSSKILCTKGTVLGTTVDNGFVKISGGTSNDHGAYISLDGKDSVNPGQFSIRANDGNTSHLFVGKADGTLAWDNKTIITDGGNQTIGGTKTFSGNVVLSNSELTGPGNSVKWNGSTLLTADDLTEDSSLAINNTYGNPILWHFGGVDCGGDLPEFGGVYDDDQWDRATQSVFMDRYAGVYYLAQQNTSYATRLVAMKWSDNPAERVRLGQTNFSYNIVGHQNNSLYRPTQDDEPLFFFPANFYNSATEGDTSKKYFVRVAKWDYTTTTPTILYSLKVFDSGTYTTDDLLAVCVSADSKKIVAEATRNSDSVRVCRVWDAAEVLAYAATATPDGNGQIDISSLVIREFEEKVGYTGQGIYCDGNFVYHLAGAYKPEIRIFPLGGATSETDNYDALLTYLSVPGWDAGIGTTWTYIQYEPEGIFWAEYGGKVQAFLHVSAALHYDDNGTDRWKRRDRFFCLSIPQNTLIFSKDSVLCFGNGHVPPTIATSTYEHARFYHVRQTNQDTNLNTYSYIATNRGNATIGEQYTSGAMEFGWSEKKKAVSYFLLRYQHKLDEETGTLSFGTSGNSFSFYVSNTATLGNSSELWKEAYIVNSTINTSDERKKDNITAFPDAVLDAWGEVGWCQYQMRDAIAEKGEDARLHSGVIAQRIASIFEAHGLDASRYGLFCYDSWDDEYEEQEDGTQKLVRKAGDGYGIRYAEALAMEAAYQRRRAARAETRIAALERRFDELEAVFAALGGLSE